jgi:hypothetical protein
MSFDSTVAGLWLVGIGSLLAAIPRLIRAPRPELGLRWESMAGLVERIHVALETVGLSTVAVGSVVLAVAELGPWWFEFGAVIVVGTAVYLVCAYKLRQLWLMRAETVANGGDRSALAPAEQRQLALENARWRRCLCQAFSRASVWPPTRDVRGEGAGDASKLEPRHIRELHDSDAMLADLHIPPSLLHVVGAIRALGFDVNVVGDLVVATSPDGRNVSVSRTALQPNTAGALLALQMFIEGLGQLGVPVRAGAQGQPQVDV